MSDSPFDGLQGTKPATDIVAGEFLKVALVGKFKVGKSWTAATMPGKKLIYDFDDRKESIAGMDEKIKADIQVKTLIDLDQSRPTAFQALESDLAILKYRKKSGKPIPDSYIFDSITYLKKAIDNAFIAGGGSKRSLKVSPSTSILSPMGWDAIQTVQAALDYLITEYSALGHICFVFHERPEKDKAESTEKVTVYTDQITVEPQFLSFTLSRFNDVFRMELDHQQKYIIKCKPTAEFTSNTILNIDSTEKPNITDLLAKSRARNASASVKP